MDSLYNSFTLYKLNFNYKVLKYVQYTVKSDSAFRKTKEFTFQQDIFQNQDDISISKIQIIKTKYVKILLL